MDAKEALRYFNFVVTLGRAYYPNSEAFKAYELAVEALEKVETLEAENARLREKETPKEPYSQEWAEFDTKEGVCNCGWLIRDSQRYCPDCGQKLDWSSDKKR